MKRIAAIILPLLLSTPLASAQDTIHFKDGKTEAGTVVELTGGFVVLRLPAPNTTVRRHRAEDIATVRFSDRPEMARARAAEGNERVDLLRRVWYLLRPSIGLPESPAGDWGLLFATAILGSQVQDNVKLSFEVFQTIEHQDWNRERRHAARRGRFNAMLNLGLMEEAMAEARAVASDPAQEDPELLIIARMMLGDLAFRQLKELEEENPRWDLDDLVRPRRNALRDDALDQYLFAHLYHGDLPESAARGLAAAIEVILHDTDRTGAAARARDLVTLYPDTEAAKSIAALAEEGKKATDKENDSPDNTEDSTNPNEP
ncbi:MAG: hypothetical protein ACKO2G_05590 [Verrucomicrobiales bacterium]